MTERAFPPATLAQLVDRIASTPDAALRFVGDDFEVRPGYHVTEVKLASIRSLDCGRGTDRWDEAVIELLDGPSDEQTSSRRHMSAATFTGIAAAAVRHVPEAATATPVIEFGAGAVRRYGLAAVGSEGDGNVVVRLAPLAARCKAFERAVGRRSDGVADRVDGDAGAACGTSTCCGGDQRSATR